MAQIPRTAREHAAASRVYNACLPRQSAAPGSGRIGAELLFLAALLLAPLVAHAGVIHVDSGAAGAANGSSWTDAYTDLQDALAIAVSGDEIWVVAGLYKPTPGTNREATFQLINSVGIYGGFAGTETTRDQRNPQTNLTVLSGDIDNNDITDANGVVVDADDIVGDNSFNVVIGSGTDATAVLDGFVITAGLANGSGPGYCFLECGGGMHNNGGSPTLANITFSGNHAVLGGGMHNLNSNSTLSQVRFIGNRAALQGGGMFHEGTPSPTLNNVSFSHNSAPRGGGMQCNSSCTLIDVSFSANLATFGGGMFSGFASSTLINVSFSGNLATEEGGGMYNSSPGNPTLTNVSFSGNNASQGGGMYNMQNRHPVIRNTVFWNNRDGSGTGTAAASISNLEPTLQISYSLVQGCNPGGVWTSACGSDGGNNLPDADPLFVSTPDPDDAPNTDGNLRLSAGSPALDSGNNSVVTALTDLAGNARIVNTTVDLGPFERPSSNCPAGGVIHVDQQATEPGDGEGWSSAFRDLQDALLIEVSCQLWVAAGVFKPVDPVDTRGVTEVERQATFQLKNGVEIYGGFAGGESTRNQRNPQTNLTVLSGDIDNNDTTDVHGVVVDADDIVGENSFHVVTGSGTDATAILDGFVITAGLANRSIVNVCGPNCGGGMYNDSGSPALANVRFSGNQALRGGGMYNIFSSNPTLTHVSFSGNQAGFWGGGMYNELSHPTLTNASFSGNRAGIDGGGMFLIISHSTLTNVTFSGNWADSRGGGMLIRSDSVPILTNVSLSGNEAAEGGGMFNLRSHPIFTNVSFSGNLASTNGGGLFITVGSDPLIRNSIFWNNRDNSGVGTAAASIYIDQSSGLISTPEISHSLMQGCNPGGTWTSDCGNDNGDNLPDADPLFVITPDPNAAPTSAGNLRLRAGSPAIDAGNDAFIDDIDNATDLDGGPRKVGEAVDLGPFEFDLLFKDRFETLAQ